MSTPSTFRPLLCASAVALVLISPGEVLAEPAPGVAEKTSRDDGVHLSVEAITVLPLQIGAQAVLELPARLEASLSFGALPAAFISLTNRALREAGAYDGATADLVAASQTGGISMRAGLGWRPFPRAGLFLSVGYGLIVMGGGLEKDTLLSEVAAAQALTAQAATNAIGLEELRVSTTLHMITAELGYRWLFWHRRIALRVALGFAGTLAANTTITPTASSASATEVATINALTAAGAARLDDVYTSYAYFPTVSVSLGYRF